MLILINLCDDVTEYRKIRKAHSLFHQYQTALDFYATTCCAISCLLLQFLEVFL
jgi:hypothetical protein